MRPRYVSLKDTSFGCMSCGASNELEDTLEGYLMHRRGKRVMRKIELDSEGYSRKWAGIFISQDTPGPPGERTRIIIRDDGHGHPSINCQQCGKVNVFGKEHTGDETIIQVLGRSEADLRLLKERERGDQGDRHHQLVREEHPAEGGLAEGPRQEVENAPDGDGDRDQGV